MVLNLNFSIKINIYPKKKEDISEKSNRKEKTKKNQPWEARTRTPTRLASPPDPNNNNPQIS